MVDWALKNNYLPTIFYHIVITMSRLVTSVCMFFSCFFSILLKKKLTLYNNNNNSNNEILVKHEPPAQNHSSSTLYRKQVKTNENHKAKSHLVSQAANNLHHTHTHARTHECTHARMHARTHTHIHTHAAHTPQKINENS